MMPSLPFKDPFVVVTRIWSSGSRIDKSWVERNTFIPISLCAKYTQFTLIVDIWELKILKYVEDFLSF